MGAGSAGETAGRAARVTRCEDSGAFVLGAEGGGDGDGEAGWDGDCRDWDSGWGSGLGWGLGWGFGWGLGAGEPARVRVLARWGRSSAEVFTVFAAFLAVEACFAAFRAVTCPTSHSRSDRLRIPVRTIV